VYAIYHEDNKPKKHRYLLKMVDTHQEADSWIVNAYEGRFRPEGDRDTVWIVNAAGQDIGCYKVDYMPVFDAVKTWKTKSSSGSGSYITQLNSTGLFSCQCKGWTFKRPDKPRECKHIKEIVIREGYQTVVQGDYIFLVDKKLQAAKRQFAGAKAQTPQDKFLAMVADYEAAIDRISKLDTSAMLAQLEGVQILKFKVDAYLTILEQGDTVALAAYERAQGKFGQAMS
jgi:hypothetical protein